MRLIAKNVIKSYKGYKPLCYINAEEVLVFKQMRFYIFSLQKEEFDYLCDLPANIKCRMLSKLRICQRIFRLEPRTAILVKENLFLVSFSGGVYLLDIEAKNVLKVHEYREGMSNVLSFTKISNLRTVDDGIYYGDYFTNSYKEPVGIYKYNEKQGIFKQIFKFSQGEINHIHQIVEDKCRDRVWIFTGDSGDAAAIWYTEDNFKSINKILGQSQLYRACKAFVVEKGLIYATDTPLEQNYIRLLKIKDSEIEEQNLAEINGSSVYGTYVGGKFIWSTTVEPQNGEKSKLLHLLSYKRGLGIKTWNSEVIEYDYKNKSIQVVNSYKKDIYPMGLCQLGSVMFIENEFQSGRLISYGSALKKIDNVMMVRQ